MQILRVVLILMAVSLLWSGQGSVQAATPAASSRQQTDDKRYITIDFENVDIQIFIKYISELTGKNFVVDKNVTGNVTILSPTKISEDEAYRVFQSVLEVHGFATVPAGSVTKIIPSVKARSQNVETLAMGMSTDPTDRVITQLIPLKHTTPDEMKKVLTPLVSKSSLVIAHTQSGMLIVTETLSNIQRLMAIIEAIDVAYTGEEVVVHPLEHASAVSVAEAVNRIFQQGKTTTKTSKPQSMIKVVPYERINALIILATAADVVRVQRLITTLDKKMERGEGNIHVFYLQNGTAKEMAKVLNTLPESEEEGEGEAKAPAISKDVKIMADEETNSLIITASRAEYAVLEEVIKKLDIPRRMVYLEVLIMEVDTNKSFEVGVEWLMGGLFSDGTGQAVSGFSSDSDSPYSSVSGISAESPTLPDGFSFGILKQGIEIGGVTFPNIAAVLRAYRQDGDVNIVSTPQILTTDNKKAEISVGVNVPYITSQNTTAGSQDYTQYEYRDVSTKLTITPHINQANTLRLEITTEVNKLKEDSSTNTPTTFKRTADTTVIVRDNDTVVIGGIIGQDATETETKVPLLGDIPVLGWLFKTEETTSNKTNMFIFITPRIIKNPADLARVTLKKEDELGNVMPQVRQELHKEVNKDHAIALTDMGFDMLSKKRYQEAKDYFDEALDIDPDNPYALINQGVVYEQLGQPDRAVAAYKKVLSLAPQGVAAGASDQRRVGASLLEIARENLARLEANGAQ